LKIDFQENPYVSDKTFDIFHFPPKKAGLTYCLGGVYNLSKNGVHLLICNL
jgi:hypothetical protein